MNTLLSIMDKIYGDSSTLTTIYIVGAVLLFVFILLLIFSLRKPKDDKREHIIEEPIIDNHVNEVKVETTSEVKEEITPVIEEKTELFTILEKAEINNEEIKEEKIEDNKNEEIVEETQEEIEIPSISSTIPDVDDYVNEVVKKTYEKNEQFSSVYVSDNTMKLDKVLDNMNVDEDIKEDIVPEEEKTEPVVEETNSENTNDENKVEENKTEMFKEEKVETKVEEPKDEVIENNNTLDNLKKALDEKKKDVSLKQDDLKAKLDMLKGNTSNKINLNDLASKLNKKD